MVTERAQLLPLLRDARAALDIHLGTLIQLTPKKDFGKLKTNTRALIAEIDAATGRVEE